VRVHTLDGVEVDAVPPDLALLPLGVFTTFVAVEGTVLGWDRHLDRLADGADALWGHRLERDRVVADVRRHLAVSPRRSVRVAAYPAQVALAEPERASGCRLLVSSSPHEAVSEAVSEAVAEPAGLAVRSVEHARSSAVLKHASLGPEVALRRQARLAGADDALFVRGGRVLEGPTWSVVAWSAGTMTSPAEDVLASTTVEALADVAEVLGQQVRRAPLTPADLRAADLVLAVNVHAPTRPLLRLDEHGLSADEDLLGLVRSALARLPRQRV